MRCIWNHIGLSCYYCCLDGRPNLCRFRNFLRVLDVFPCWMARPRARLRRSTKAELSVISALKEVLKSFESCNCPYASAKIAPIIT